MFVSTWLQLLWVALSAGALLALKNDFVQGLAVTGKVRAAAGIAQRPGAALLQFEVPKSYWTWFYLLGMGFNALLLLVLIIEEDNPIVQALLRALQTRDDGTTSGIASSFFAFMLTKPPPLVVNNHTIAFFILFVLHLARRFIESLLITQWGDSKMHVTGFALGCIHYVGVGVSVLADRAATSDVQQDALWRRTIVASGALLYVVASYHQSVCNALLAQLKTRSKQRHVVPTGDWFDNVQSPLYATEVLLYVALALVAGGTNVSLWIVVLWVVVNQSVAAQLNADWYDRKLREENGGGNKKKTKTTNGQQLPQWKLVPHVW